MQCGKQTNKLRMQDIARVVSQSILTVRQLIGVFPYIFPTPPAAAPATFSCSQLALPSTSPCFPSSPQPYLVQGTCCLPWPLLQDINLFSHISEHTGKSVQTSLVVWQKNPGSCSLSLPQISGKIPPTQLFIPSGWVNRTEVPRAQCLLSSLYAVSSFCPFGS